MKILLIYTETDKESAGRLRSLLEKTRILTECFPIAPADNKDLKQFTAFFDTFNSESQQNENPTHAVIISSLSTSWFDFFAGFSCGSRLPFLVYGQEAMTGISMEFASCFTFLNTEDSLQKYLEAENEVSRKQEAARDIIMAQETLLKMGIPLTTESLAQCAAEGRIRELSYFLAAGFSPDTRNKTGIPLLNIAARSGNGEILRYLILAGAQINLQSDDRGTTALMDSVMGKQHDLVRDLIRAGSDLGIKSKNGQSALLLAVGSGDDELVDMLLKAGADPDQSDSMGLSARSYAALMKKSSMTALFDAATRPT